MKAVSIFAIVAVVGFIVVGYVLTSQSSLNWDKLKQDYSINEQTTQKDIANYIDAVYQRGELVSYIKPQSLIALGAGLFLSLGGVVIVLHLVIDKLFFCKYYQHPDLKQALLRGVLWASFPLVVIYLGVWHYLNSETAFLVVLFYLFIEVLSQGIYKKFKAQKNSEPTENPEKIVNSENVDKNPQAKKF